MLKLKQSEAQLRKSELVRSTAELLGGCCARFVGLLFIACLMSLRALALDPGRPLIQLHHTSWDERAGLSGSVFALAQTVDGYLWIGTSTGLYRFDGIVFERYTPQSGRIPSSEVRSLLATADGGLWVGFRNNISFIRSDKASTYTEAEGVPYGRVRSLAHTRDGSIWAAVVGSLARFNNGRWSKVRADWNYPGKSADTVFVDSHDTLWVGSGERIVFLRSGAHQFEDAGLAVGFIPKIAEAPDGSMWFSDGSHDTVKSMPSPLQKERFVATQIPIGAWDLLFDKEGSFWLAGEIVGVQRLEPGEIHSSMSRKRARAVESFGEREGLSDNICKVMLEDREGNLWVGTPNGLDRFRGRNASQVDLGGNYHSLIAGDHGDVWAEPLLNGPIIRVRDRKPLLTGLKGIATTAVDRDGSFWISTGEEGKTGVWRFSSGKLTEIAGPPHISKPRITDLTFDHDGTMWASVSGYGEYTLKKGKWQYREILSDEPHLTPDSEFGDDLGRVWLVYYARQVVALVENDRVKIFNAASGLNIGAPTVVAGLGKRVWIGGDAGLAYYDGKNFRQIKGMDGAMFSGIVSIVPTLHDGLWIEDLNGVAHISESDTEKVMSGSSSVIPYELFNHATDFDQPLFRGDLGTSSNTRAVQGSDGRLWFLTKGGVAFLNPRHLITNKLPPPVLVRSLTADGKKYSTSAPVRLPASTRNLVVDYDALSLTFSERNQFRYQLIGFDSGWQEAKNRRQAFYTNLSPGTYTFRVIASNNDGVWNKTGATFVFVMPPQLLQTTWFRVLLLTAFSLALFLLFRWRMLLMEERARERLTERLVERERIARELHDTLLQGVQALVFRFRTVTKKIPTYDPVRAVLEDALNLADEVVVEGKNRVQDLRSDDELSTLAESLTKVGEELKRDREVSFSLGVHGAPRPLHRIVREETYWIGREALSNAFLHGGGTKIEVQITYERSQFILRINDNGSGIEDEQLEEGNKGHWGLIGMRERARQLDGHFHIKKADPEGTEVELKIAARVAYQT